MGYGNENMNLNDLSVTEKYLLVSLNNKGYLPSLGIEINSCFVVSGILDMCFSESIVIGEKNRIKTVKPLPKRLDFLADMYEEIKRKGNYTIEKLTSEYVLSFTGKKFLLYEKAVAESLHKKGVAELEIKKGVFSEKVICVPKPNEKDKVIQEMRAEFLEEGEMTDDMILLGTLMYKSQQIKKYFSKYESDCLKKRLKEIKETREGELISKAVDYVVCVLVAAT